MSIEIDDLIEEEVKQEDLISIDDLIESPTSSNDDDDLFIIEENPYYVGEVCTFHGSSVKDNKCPHCGSNVVKFDSYNKFISAFPKKWDLDNPMIKNFFDWLSKTECHDSVPEAAKEYNKQTGERIYVKEHKLGKRV